MKTFFCIFLVFLDSIHSLYNFLGNLRSIVSTDSYWVIQRLRLIYKFTTTQIVSKKLGEICFLLKKFMIFLRTCKILSFAGIITKFLSYKHFFFHFFIFFSIKHIVRIDIINYHYYGLLQSDICLQCNVDCIQYRFLHASKKACQKCSCTGLNENHLKQVQGHSGALVLTLDPFTPFWA